MSGRKTLRFRLSAQPARLEGPWSPSWPRSQRPISHITYAQKFSCDFSGRGLIDGLGRWRQVVIGYLLGFAKKYFNHFGEPRYSHGAAAQSSLEMRESTCVPTIYGGSRSQLIAWSTGGGQNSGTPSAAIDDLKHSRHGVQQTALRPAEE
jgi:hypothetical protein